MVGGSTDPTDRATTDGTVGGVGGTFSGSHIDTASAGLFKM